MSRKETEVVVFQVLQEGQENTSSERVAVLVHAQC